MLKEADQQMETRAWIAIILILLVGCDRPPTGGDIAATVPPQPETLQLPSETVRKQDGPRKLKLTLTLGYVSGSEVKEGDQVSRGR